MTQARNGHAFEGGLVIACRRYMQENGVSWDWDSEDQKAIKSRLDAFQYRVPQDLRELMGQSATRAINFLLAERLKLSAHYLIGCGDDPQNMDISDVTLRSGTHSIRFSAKWNNPEIKSCRFTPQIFCNNFGSCDLSPWVVNSYSLQELENQWKNRLWREIKREIGSDFVHDLYQQALLLQLKNIQQSEEASRRFAAFVFGQHDYFKVLAKPRKNKVPRVEIGHYKHKLLVPEITNVRKDANPRHVFITFGDSWIVRARLHNKDGIVVPGGMSLSFSVRSWGGEPPCVLT